MSDPVDPEVLDRAVEEGRESVRTGMHVNTTQGYQEQEFRAIAAAAYRQGREDLLARIEAKARNHDKWAEIDEKASRTTEDDHFKSESFSMRAAHHRIRAEVLRSLLTDKEGAGSLASTNTKEECPEPMGSFFDRKGRLMPAKPSPVDPAVEAARQACLTVKVSGLNTIDCVIVDRSVNAARPLILAEFIERLTSDEAVNAAVSQNQESRDPMDPEVAFGAAYWMIRAALAAAVHETGGEG